MWKRIFLKTQRGKITRDLYWRAFSSVAMTQYLFLIVLSSFLFAFVAFSGAITDATIVVDAVTIIVTNLLPLQFLLSFNLNYSYNFYFQTLLNLFHGLFYCATLIFIFIFLNIFTYKLCHNKFVKSEYI